jgi:nucleoside-diphosphate kinase
MLSGPIVCMIWKGLNAVKAGRLLIGEPNVQLSRPGTIRGDFSTLNLVYTDSHAGRNVVHGSDSPEEAQREISIWFTANEIVTWNSCHKNWLFQ